MTGSDWWLIGSIIFACLVYASPAFTGGKRR